MRQLMTHRINPTNDLISIVVEDDPGAGGAHHQYCLSYTDSEGTAYTHLRFQEGPIAEVGVNGITQEALLAVVIDRLACFQAGPFPSPTNAEALDHCRLALEALHRRTLERIARGVEGQTKP